MCIRDRSYIGDCEKKTPGYKLKYSKFSKAKKVHTNKCHPVKDPFWDTEDLDGSDIPTDEKVRGDAIRLQEEKERTGAIQVKEKKIVFINTGMLSLSESDIIDFSVPELYQGCLLYTSPCIGIWHFERRSLVWSICTCMIFMCLW